MTKKQLYPKLADGSVDITDIIEIGHGQKHGTIQTWEDTGAPAFFRGGDWHFILKAKITFADYWKAFDGPNGGHTGFMQRATLSDIPSGNYKGHGPIFANLWTGGGNPIGEVDRPCVMLESWGVPIVPPAFGFIRKGSNSPRIEDNKSYDFMAVSTTFCDSIYSRYYIGGMDYATSQYVALKDTRDMEDNNWGMNREQSALALFDASSVADRNKAYPDARMLVERLTAYWIPATGVYA